MSLDPPEPEDVEQWLSELEARACDVWLRRAGSTTIVCYLVSREMVPIPNRLYARAVERLRAAGVIEGAWNEPRILRARLARKREVGD
ncbi:MAG: hypothetical protein JNK05_37740 [Myxococcales bacterium]|nr:hypothetical protein [Myxococcales bacterium]